jgi:hypothetical protein
MALAKRTKRLGMKNARTSTLASPSSRSFRNGSRMKKTKPRL